MGFLIPAAPPNPGILARLGRLVHWTALGGAALLLVPAYFAATQSASVPGQPVLASAPSPAAALAAASAAANPFDQFDTPAAPIPASAAPPAASTPASAQPARAMPWDNDPIVACAPQRQGEYGFAPAPGPARQPVAAPTAPAAGDPWAVFDGVAPSVQQDPATAAALGRHPQGLPYGFWLVAAAAIALGGRGARYLFAGE